MAAAKPKFPSKPCPKCGEAIHARSLSHKKCGWEGLKAAPKVQASAEKKTTSGKKRGRPAGSGKKSGTTGEVTMVDIQAVKALVDKIGAAQVKQLAEVLG